uniref:Helitron helicase-like domain-containing protein n=1 Tax=Aegilops tauschii subsp. strangulata TaxID=200361 RepID=A0A453QHJ8_AEGTS
KHVTPGKRQTSLHYRNEEFTTRQMKMVSVTSQEDGSMPATSKDDIGPLEESEVVIYDNPSSMFPCTTEVDAPTQTLYSDDNSKVALWPDIPSSLFPTIREVDARIQSFYNEDHGNDEVICEQEATIKEVDAPTQSIYHQDHGNDEVIFEEDTDEEEYMFPGEDPVNGLWVTMREYYCYKFHTRPNIFNPILHGGRLFQQFVVDTYIKIENSRLDYLWHHQKEIRADLYQDLVDNIQAGEQKGNAVGKRTVLASSFIGGPRDKLRRYQDAMALVRKYGKPDIFLSMT